MVHCFEREEMYTLELNKAFRHADLQRKLASRGERRHECKRLPTEPCCNERNGESNSGLLSALHPIVLRHTGDLSNGNSRCTTFCPRELRSQHESHPLGQSCEKNTEHSFLCIFFLCRLSSLTLSLYYFLSNFVLSPALLSIQSTL
jgi:hypothetical protein